VYANHQLLPPIHTSLCHRLDCSFNVWILGSCNLFIIDRPNCIEYSWWKQLEEEEVECYSMRGRTHMHQSVLVMAACTLHNGYRYL
jgi:hypothetical protein